MRIESFDLERWQSVWENRVELNIAESGVEPLTVRELAGDPADLDRLIDVRLGYPQTNGSEELRTRIAALYPGAKAANALVTCGAAEANYLVSWALTEPGDEMIFMQPNYMQVAGLARAFGASVKPLRLREELGWSPDTDELARMVTSKTRLIAICNPNNPTGAVLSETAMQAICAAAGKCGAWILADEVYRGAELDGETTPTFWGRYERILCTAGLSKAYGLPGLRTGWVIGPPDMAEKLWGYHDYTSISATLLTDRLASIALEPARHRKLIERTRRILREHYPVIGQWLESHKDQFTHIPPRAGAIAWVGLRGMKNSADVAETLRAKKGVLLVPGELFGMPGYLRIGFGGNAAELRQALGRIDEWFCESLRSDRVSRTA
ncbi:MAG TPA: aminotransferase class I/II-fold pyridoxal phosphate-dependent enzyme [Candidatus Acidoferrales bacterium]|nr:aminotransferase class I/II-fold pyridoxal phosphate-dependent enzyme [Candidatus Acidoferrales bacterium]